MNTTPTTLTEKFLLPLREILGPIAVFIAVSGSVMFSLGNRDAATPAAEVGSMFNAVARPDSNTIVLGEDVNITNIIAGQHEPPTVEWLGHPSVVVKNRHGSMEDGWATEIEIGMRSDGVVVWRKAKVEK